MTIALLSIGIALALAFALFSMVFGVERLWTRDYERVLAVIPMYPSDPKYDAVRTGWMKIDPIGRIQKNHIPRLLGFRLLQAKEGLVLEWRDHVSRSSGRFRVRMDSMEASDLARRIRAAVDALEERR